MNARNIFRLTYDLGLANKAFLPRAQFDRHVVQSPGVWSPGVCAGWLGYNNRRRGISPSGEMMFKIAITYSRGHQVVFSRLPFMIWQISFLGHCRNMVCWFCWLITIVWVGGLGLRNRISKVDGELGCWILYQLPRRGGLLSWAQAHSITLWLGNQEPLFLASVNSRSWLPEQSPAVGQNWVLLFWRILTNWSQQV